MSDVAIQAVSDDAVISRRKRIVTGGSSSGGGSFDQEDGIQLENNKSSSSNVERILRYCDYEKTVLFLSSFYKFSMLICVAAVIGCSLDLWISYDKIEAANLIFEKTFILAGIGVSFCYFVLMAILRNQWPINTFINNMLYLWIGLIAGFIMCTHLKIIIRTIESNDN